MFENLDFTPGRITHDALCLNFKLPLADQIEFLQEDIFQVEYGQNYVLDIGWYPSCDLSGSFKIFVVKDSDWENPIIEKVCCTLDDLFLYVQECIDLIRLKLQGENSL